MVVTLRKRVRLVRHALANCNSPNLSGEADRIGERKRICEEEKQLEGERVRKPRRKRDRFSKKHIAKPHTGTRAPYKLPFAPQECSGTARIRLQRTD